LLAVAGPRAVAPEAFSRLDDATVALMDVNEQTEEPWDADVEMVPVEPAVVAESPSTLPWLVVVVAPLVASSSARPRFCPEAAAVAATDAT
jgi:hypothetical protein